jgi:predicted dehydrogenase
VKILIAGLGSVGRRHLRNLAALGERDILLYRSRLSTLPEEELAGYPVYEDLDAAFAAGPEAAIVATPTARHLEVAIPAAEAGCHLLIEKPLTHSMDRVDDLRSAVEARGVKVLMGYQFRFHPGLREVKRELDAGSIGRPLYFHAHWGEHLGGWHPWEDYRLGYSARADLGGGALLTLCHPLDYLRWFFGEAVVAWAELGRISELEIDVEDVAELYLHFDSGVQGSLHLDYFQRPPSHYLEIAGSAGTIRWDNREGGVHRFRSGDDRWEYLPPPQGFERNSMFLDELRHFLDVCRGVSRPVCTLEDGIRSMQLIAAAKNIAGTVGDDHLSKKPDSVSSSGSRS